MAKVTVDAAACTGCGLCAATCPDGYEMTGDSKAIVKNENPGTCDMKQVASECPVDAIKVE